MGTSDPRLRATWRVLLAWPLLWLLAGTISVAVGRAVVPAGSWMPTSMLVFGMLQGAVFLVAWIGWARYLDRRALSEYGLAASRGWLLDLFVGFCAVVVGHGVWYALGSSLGWVSVETPMAAPEGSLALGLVSIFAALAVNVWVQETVFVAVTVRNAAEGLASRGLTPSRAVVGAWLVAVALFALKHRPTEPERVLNLGLALGVFGLLYVHTGELALPVGVHLGVNYAGNALFSAGSAGGPTVFLVADSTTGLLGSLSAGRIPQILVAYLLLVGWVRLRHGEVGVETGLARWTGP